MNNTNHENPTMTATTPNRAASSGGFLGHWVGW